MANVVLQASLVAEAQTESRLGRAIGLAVNIKDPEGPSPYINAGPRPGVLKIDESKFQVMSDRGGGLP